MSLTSAPIIGALGGCMGCMVFVEKIAKEEPSSMNLMTFSTFLFIACQGLVFTSKFLTVPIKIPLRGYTQSVLMFFIVNVINNQALNFHVPVPLHIIFRSGSLLANLFLSVILLKKNYTFKKYLSVIAITVGIVLCTLATSDIEKNSNLSFEEATKHYQEWCIGILMLIFALLASAYLAICQQQLYKSYGKHPEEAMFITHAVSLPLFSFFGADIMAAAKKFCESTPFRLAGITTPIPSLWVDLLLSCILQYYCIKFVYRLNAEVEALTVTLVVTLRKFLSLVISIWWFENPFTLQHWIGALFVFAGTLAFADIPSALSSQEKKK
ncbi:UAA transporter family protein [Dictyocaulus viviparus]|uniref:UAA transporter family protein n=1 Tax=Dictyocaulus viviparus TaxID=29172 RepID=A0A0D8X966_DICVI|nr:UAA transporter family protein [Dictyocaulus viviparus]